MNDRDFDTYHRQTRAELIADITGDAEKVVRGLEILRDPDIVSREFTVEAIGRNIVIPSSILQSLEAGSSPEDVVIVTNENNLTGASSVSIRITFLGSEPLVVFAYPTNKSDAEPFDSSIVFMKDIQAYENWYNLGSDEPSLELPLLDRLTKVEMNTLIASIIAPNKTHDYRMYETLDLTNPATVHHVAEALEDCSDSIVSNVDYYTSTPIGLDTDCVRFTKIDGVPANVSVQRSLERGAVAASIVIDKSLVPDELETIGSLEGIEAVSVNINGESSDRDLDFDILVSLHDFLRSLKETMFSPEIESLPQSGLADSSGAINLEHLKEFDPNEEL